MPATQIIRPEAGQTTTVRIDSDNMRLSLGFEPDPNAVEKNGQNLEFAFEDGGKVVLEGYYDHFASKTLPVMVLESGDELEGEDFLASLREDLLTAAGPGAGAGAPGSGAGEYSDDAGSLIDGVGRLGSLGTIYWGYDSEVPEEYSGVFTGEGADTTIPSLGDMGLTVETNVNGVIYAGAFEDAQPFQHVGDRTDYLAELIFSLTPAPGSVITAVHLTGFPAGTEIYLGEPPTLYMTIGEDGVLDLTPEQISGGVYLRPPFDTDLDMFDIASTVDLVHTGSGLTATVTGPVLTVIVDAAADKPEMNGGDGFVTPELEGSITVSENEGRAQDLRDGWATDDLSKSSETVITDPTAVRVSVDFHTSIRFGDYQDGSETHYALVEVPSIGTWSPVVNTPAGVSFVDTITLYFDADGNCLGSVEVDGAVSSKDFFRFEVSNDALVETGGVLDLNVTFTSTDTGILRDTSITLETGAMAVENEDDMANELWLGNNESYTFNNEAGQAGLDAPNFVIDTIDSQLSVRVGWASEDNDNSQHVVGPYTPNYAGMNDHHPTDGNIPGVDANSTTVNGAPIIFSISGSAGESMDSIKLFFNPESGSILINGVAQTPVQDANGNWYVELTANNGIAADGLGTSGVTFLPGIAHSDIDVPMGYEVSVISSAGASAIYTGNTIVVIDAVADLPTNVDGSFNDGSDYLVVPGATGTVINENNPAAGPNQTTGWENDTFTPGQSVNLGQTITVNLTANFADTDGSEDHFILVQAMPSGWSVDPASLAAAGLEDTGRTITGPDGNTYMVFQVVDSSLGQFSASITIGVTAAVTGDDQTFTIKTGAMAEERVDNAMEYDLGNNQAVVINDDVMTVDVDVINSGLAVNVGWASESNNDAKHLGETSGGYAPGSGVTQSGATGATDMNVNLGAPIEIDLTGAAQGSGESINEVTFTFTENRGSLVFVDDSGVATEYPLQGTGPFTVTVTDPAHLAMLSANDTSGTLYFRPDSGSYNDLDVAMDYAVTVGNTAGASVIYTGSATIAIDAVADLPVDTSGVFANGTNSLTLPGATDTVITEAANEPGVNTATGWDTDSFDTKQTADQSQTFTVKLAATFNDTDGSENHYVLLQVMPEGLALDPSSLAGAGLTDTGDTIVQDGITYMVLQVNDVNGRQVGDYEGTVTIKVVSAASDGDQNYTINTGAMAVEKADGTTGTIEYDTANNTAIVINEDTPLQLTVDVINSDLTVNVGWASENNNDAKHIGDNSDGYISGVGQAGATGTTGVDGAGDNLGAPIIIALNNTQNNNGTQTVENSAESITQIKVYYNPEAGVITVDGVALPAAGTDAGGTYVLLTVGNGGIAANGQATGSVHFQPLDTTQNYSDLDTSIRYEVTVENTAGAKVVYKGEAEVAIDAVADLGVFGNDLKANYNNATDTAAEPGEVISITGSITFADTADGSEYHYIVADIPTYWNVIGGPNLNTEAGVHDNFVKPTACGDKDYSYNLGLQGDGQGYLVLEMPPVDAFTNGSYNSANGVTISLSVQNGVATYTYSVNDTEFATVKQDLKTGEANFEFKLEAPSFDGPDRPNLDDSDSVSISGISVEKDAGTDYEYDYANNVAVVTADPIPVECDGVTSQLAVNFFMHEDAMPGHYWDGASTPSTGAQDTTIKGPNGETTYPEHGYQINIYLVDPNHADYPSTTPGAASDDNLTAVQLVDIPDASQGTIWYTADGITWTAITQDNLADFQGKDLDPEGFYFRPSESWSGEVSGFEITGTIKSPTSGHTVTETPVLVNDDGSLVTTTDGDYVQGTDIFVESVADLAEGGILQNIKEDGHLVMDQVGKGEADDAGWFTTEHGGDQSYTTQVTIPLNFGDTDGSEYGRVLIEVQDGITFPGASIENIGGVDYWVVAEGSIKGGDLTSAFVDANGNVVTSITVNVVIDNKVDDGTGKLVINDPEIKAYIETRETEADASRETDNDLAIRELEGLEMPTFDSTLKVQVGWTYEGNADGKADGAKHGGDVNTPSQLEGSHAGEFGVPIRVEFTSANGESMPAGDIYFTCNAAAGEFYWNGTLCTAESTDGGMATYKFSLEDLESGLITFKPTTSYSDADIKLQYEMVVTDETKGPNGEDVTFKVKGETVVVMDAVADQALIKGESAQVNDDQSGVVLSVKTSFADNDPDWNENSPRSEGHYILVEVPRDADGEITWTCDNSTVVPIWVDASGHPVLPIGYDAATGVYSYPAGSTQKDFYQVDVTGQSPDKNGNYNVTIRPVNSDEPTDLDDLIIATMVKEENLAGEEYNYLNNVAYDTTTVDVQALDSGLYAKEHIIHEENLPKAHVGSPETDSGLVLTLTIGKGADGSEDGGEYLHSEGYIEITFTFEGTAEEAAAMVKDGYFVIGDYKTSAKDITDHGDGTFTLKVPVDQTGLAGETEIQVKYFPATDQDNDLSNVSVTLPVTNDTGYTDTLTAEDLYITVDAVADQPIVTKGSANVVDPVDPANPDAGTYDKADWGSKVEITVTAQFKDYKDGSETHYLLLEAKEGWKCDEPGVIVITLYYKQDGTLAEPDSKGNYPPQDGGTYTSKDFFAKEATTFDADGNATDTFTVTTPMGADKTNAGDAEKIMDDESVTLITGGLAVEGTVGSDGKIDVTVRETEGGTYENVDGAYYNNIAFGEGSVSVDFNVINDGTGGTSGAYEDHSPWKDDGKFTEAQDAFLDKDGEITITLDDPSGKDYIVPSADSGKDNVITFTYNSERGGTPGDFTYTYEENGVTQTGTISYPSANYTLETDGTNSWYQVIIPDAAIDADGRGVTLTYNPPAYDNTDLTDMNYVLNAKAEDSKAMGEVKGGITTEGFENQGSTLIVDSVADKPTMTDFTEASYAQDGTYVPGSVKYGTKVDDSGETAEAARPDQKVEVAVSVTFRDVQEGGEDHYIIIKNGNWNGVTGVGGVEYGKTSDIPSDTDKGNIANGCTIINVTDMIESVVSGWDGKFPHDGVEVVPGLTITLSLDASGAVVATVNTSIFVTVPSETALKNALDNDEGSTGIKLEVAGVAVDRDTDGSLDKPNDVAVDWQDTIVKVEVVGSDIEFKIENDHIFENLTPNAHLDPADLAKWEQQLADYQNPDVSGVEPPIGKGIIFQMKGTGEVLREYQLDSGEWVLWDSNRNVVDWNDVEVAQPDQYATVKFSGLADGETADITLTFSCPDGIASPGQVHIIIDGVIVDTVNIVNGQVVINDFAASNYGSQYNANSTITFAVDPGDNFSHEDFNIGYEVVVTDNATGQTQEWAATGDKSGLDVHVDAVAQRPEFAETDGGKDVYQTTTDGFAHGGVNDKDTVSTDDDGYYRDVIPGQPIFINTTLQFQDVNVDKDVNGESVNSSKHYVLVEATTGGMFVPTEIIISWVGEDGETYSVSVPVSGTPEIQAYDGRVYYRVEVTADLQEVPSVNGLQTVNVQFKLTSHETSTDTSIRVGAATHEVTATVQQDAEATLDNNTAFIVSDEIPISFGTLPTLTIGKSENWVSEDDMSTANTTGKWVDGQFTADRDGGVLLELNFSENTSLVSLDVDMGTVSGGTLYYLDADGVHGNMATYKPVPADGSVPTDAVALVFVPDNNQTDTEFIPDIHYDAVIKNDLSGQIEEHRDQTITILVDAVAQKPMVAGVTFEDGSSVFNGELNLDHKTNTAEGAENTQRTETITITGKFVDSDGSEIHYGLITIVPNMTVEYQDAQGKWHTATETFEYEGVLYYKVPMLANDTVDVQLVFLSHKLTAEGHDSDTISFRTLTEETVTDGNGNRENNYDNNYAVSEIGGELTVTHDWQPGDIIWIDPNYENNTPNADDEEEHKDKLTWDDEGGKITFGNADIASFELTVHEDVGAIYVRDENGVLQKLTGVDTNGDGMLTYTLPRYGTDSSGNQVEFEYHFKPTAEYQNLDKFNYDDVDASIYYTAYNSAGEIIGGGNGAAFPAVIDAVAQLPVADASTVDYDPATAGTANDRYTAVGDPDKGGNNGEVTLSIGSEGFKDNTDGSETHYALIRKVADYQITNGDELTIDTVYIDGEAYWRIEIPAGKSSVDVDIKVNASAFDENREFSIQTGLMSEEKNYGGIVNGKADAETDVTNNLTYVMGDKVTVYYSPVDTSVTIDVKNTYENDEAGLDGLKGGQITITVALGADDVLNSLTLAVPAGVSGVVVDGDGNTVGNAGDIINLVDLIGSSVLEGILAKTATDYGINTKDMSQLQIAQALAEAKSDEIDGKLADLGLRFKATGYVDEDLPDFVVNANVTDALSKDTTTVTAKDDAIVDAVAHASEFGKDGVKTGMTDDDGNLIAGNAAAENGQILTAVVNLTFADLEGGEEHYAIIGQHHEWPVTGVRYYQNGEWHDDGELITFFDSKGTPYYALKIENSMFDDLTTGEIKVAFDIQTPDTTRDISQVVKVGGASVETNMGTPTDMETNLLNNWAENVQDVTLAVGVVETSAATMSFASGAKYEDTAVQLQFTLTGDNNDSIQSVTIADLKGGVIGVYENNIFVPKFSGTNVTLDGAIAEAGGYYYMPKADYSGSVKLDYQITVQDDASGATKTFPANGNSTTSASFTAVADKPTDVSTDAVVDYDPSTNGVQPADPDAAKASGKVSFEVTATFGDYTDNSESHYILVQAKSGWSCPGATTVDGYFRIPVSNAVIAEGNGTVTITVNLTAPSTVNADASVEFQVGALSVDGSSKAATYATDKVTVEVGVVETTASTITTKTVGTVMEDAKGADGAAISITLDKGDAYNETITGVQVNNLQGGRIWDTAANNGQGDWLSGITLDVAGAQSGRYLYVAGDNKSGNVTNISFKVTVEDNASGASKTITDTMTVFVTPDTDIPVDQSATDLDNLKVQTGHEATITVVLSADFEDYTGTEIHFFLVQLPEGATLADTDQASSAEKAAAGMTGTVYKVAVNGNGNSVDLKLTLDEDYEGGAITYKAGSVEKAISGKYAGGEYEFSDPGTYVVDADAATFNTAPKLNAPGSSLNLVRGTSTTGDVGMTDDDGDDVAITGVKSANGSGYETVAANGSTTVDGVYGELTINSNGSYSYKLYAENDPRYTSAPAAGQTDKFMVVGTDDYAGNAMTSDAAQITISMTNVNSVPQPTSAIQYGVSGNVNATGSDLVTQGEYGTKDSDNDEVTITGFTLNDTAAKSSDGGQTWTAQGKYGTLTMDSEGNYTYIRTNEYNDGQEQVTVTFTDGIASNSGTLIITAAAVNHAPEAEDKVVTYQDNAETDLKGKLTLSDVDGDTARVASVMVDNVSYAVTAATWTTGIVTDDFTLKISADGYYSFTWNKGWDDGATHTFEYTVTDNSTVDAANGSLETTGSLTFYKGTDTEYQDSLSGSGQSGLSGRSLPTSTEDGVDTSTAQEADAMQIYSGTTGEALNYDSLAGDDDDAGSTGTDGADVFAWQASDMGGTDTILDFSFGEDKLFFEQLFGGSTADVQAALAEKLEAGDLDVSINAAGDQVQLTMGDQVVDVYLTESLDGGMMDSINNDDSSAKAALLEMMITQVTG